MINLNQSYELVVTFLGAMFAGVVPSIAPYASAFPSLLAQIEWLQRTATVSQASAVLTNPESVDVVDNRLQGSTCHVSLAPVLKAGLQECGNNKEGVPISQNNLPAAGPEDIAYIQFSSGSTGPSKGVMISHRAAIRHCEAMDASIQYTRSDVNVGWLPLYHAMGLQTQLITPMLMNFHSVMLNNNDWIGDPKKLLWAVNEYGGTITWMPNFGFLLCARQVDDQELQGLDLSSWRVLGNGSEPVQQDIFEVFYQRFHNYHLKPDVFIIRYGMAENVAGVTLTKPGRLISVDWVSTMSLQRDNYALPGKPGTLGIQPVVGCGRPLEGTRIKVVDDDGKRLPDRQVGQVMVTGQSLFSGYYRNPALTADSLDGGWFQSGDLGYLIDGQLFICGRKKDVVIIGGEKVQPEAIEEIAKKILVQDGARVVGFGVLNSSLGTETPVLVCEILREVDDEERISIQNRLRRGILSALGISLGDIRFVPPGWVVTTPSGKIARNDCREKYRKAGFFTNDKVSPLLRGDDLHSQSKLTIDELTVIVGQHFTQILGIEQVTPQDDFFHLGGDSIGYLRLVSDLEKFLTISIPARDLDYASTPVAISQVLHQKQIDLLPTSNLSQIEYPELSYLLAILRSPSLSTKAKVQQIRMRMRKRVRENLFGLPGLSYDSGHRLICWLTRQNFGKNLLLHRRTSDFLSLLEAIESTQDANEELDKHLAFTIGRAWRYQKMLAVHEFDNWISLNGLEIFQEARKDRRGLILLSHHSLSEFALKAFIKINEIDIFIVGAFAIQAVVQEKRDPPIKGQHPIGMQGKRLQVGAAQFLGARRHLERGGVILVMGDGIEGRSGLTLDFLGRKRHFPAGFSELVVQTGAQLLPVFTTAQMNGHAKIDFMEPLVPSGSSRQKKIESLIFGYAGLLADRWQCEPWDIIRAQAKYYLGLPISESK